MNPTTVHSSEIVGQLVLIETVPIRQRKGNKTATIPLSPRTARALDLYIGERESGPIFINHDGTSRLDRHASCPACPFRDARSGSWRGPSELSGASGLVQFDNDRLGWSGDQRSNQTRDVVFPNDRVVAGH